MELLWKHEFYNSEVGLYIDEGSFSDPKIGYGFLYKTKKPIAFIYKSYVEIIINQQLIAYDGPIPPYVPFNPPDNLRICAGSRDQHDACSGFPRGATCCVGRYKGECLRGICVYDVNENCGRIAIIKVWFHTMANKLTSHFN